MTLGVEERLHVTPHQSRGGSWGGGGYKQTAMREMGKTSHWEIFRDPAQLQKMRPFPEQKCAVPFAQHVGSRWQKSNVVVEGRLQGEPSLALTPPRLPRIPARSWHTKSEYEAQDGCDLDRDHEEPAVNMDTRAQVFNRYSHASPWGFPCGGKRYREPLRRWNCPGTIPGRWRRRREEGGGERETGQRSRGVKGSGCGDG
jgi:hypothetical protein